MSDFCLGRPMLDRVLRQAELMDRVMEQLGVNPAIAVASELPVVQKAGPARQFSLA